MSKEMTPDERVAFDTGLYTGYFAVASAITHGSDVDQILVGVRRELDDLETEGNVPEEIVDGVKWFEQQFWSEN